MQFGVQILTAANVPYPENFEPDNRLLRFFGVIILTFICLIHFFSGRVGRAMNQAFAFVKIALLLIVLGAGIHFTRGRFVRKDWFQSPNPNPSSSATAFLYIVFSFAGWENATFVSGEVPSNKVLRKGCLLAVSIVGSLYVLINLVFVRASLPVRSRTDLLS
jgi:amino acid transporter